MANLKDFASDDELRLIEGIEAKIKKLDAQKRNLSSHLLVINNSLRRRRLRDRAEKIGINEDGLPVEELRNLLEYDPKTGLVRYKVRPIEYSVSERENKRWNARHAGKLAFRVLNNGSYEGGILGVVMQASRVCWALHHGFWPKGAITHKNLDRKDNRAVNLVDTKLEKISQRQAKRRDNTSGVQGVNWNKRNKKWTASIFHKGKSKHLGSFDDMKKAIEARKIAEADMGFDENHGLLARVVRKSDGTKVSITPNRTTQKQNSDG